VRARLVVFPTTLGHVAILYTEKVQRIFLPLPSRERIEAEIRSTCEPVFPSRHPPLITDLMRGIQEYLIGSPVTFALDSLDFSRCYPFQERVLRAGYTIPYGEVRTYQWIAEQIGAPRAARAVGMALARNPFPLVIPCHRCIRSDGTIGGFQRPGLKEKLLLLEGHIIERGKLIR